MTSRTGKRPKVVWSPSDLGAAHPRGSVRVAGRVLSARGTALVVADALGALRVRLLAKTSAVEGDLVVVEGRLLGKLGKSLEGATVVEAFAGRPVTADSEFGRLGLAGVGKNLVSRGEALRVVRAWFDEEGFVEVTTPVRVSTPGLDAHVNAIPAEGGYLITSPELHMKRLVTGGLPRVYQIAHVLRADEQGALHEPEFAMLEWYRAFAGMDAMVRDTEHLVSTVVRALSGRSSVRVGKKRVNVRPPFPRLTVRDAFRRYAAVEDAVALAAADPDVYFQTFVDHVEPGLASATRPVVLTEFPASEGALARPCPHDPSVAERFEIYVGGVELCNGFGELTDASEQRRRFLAEQERRRRTGAPVYALDERFLAALGEGLPPSGGNALGLDRLVALALGEARIANVMAFPRDWP